MAPTLLGYPDEEIQDKHFSQIDFTTSKIGGLPVSIFSKPYIKAFGNRVIAVFPKILKTVKKLVKTLKVNKFWI